MHAVLTFPEIDPAIFSVELFGITLALRWYALAYIVGLLLAWWIVRGLMARPQLWRDQTPPMDTKAPEDLLTYMIIGVILGGRLGFVLFYRPAHYLANPGDILKVWEGGMSFHGGNLMLFGKGQQSCPRRQVPFPPWCDDLDFRVQGIGRKFEPHLIVALAGCAMGHGIGTGLGRNLDQPLGNQWPRD